MQYAALPWRMNGGALEILLITTLKTHRWIVPKGWPVEALSPQACAAHEALEEAGVSGSISEKTIGSFRNSASSVRFIPTGCGLRDTVDSAPCRLPTAM